MDELRFRVEGSAPEPYEVRIVRREGRNVSAYCTCPAGQSGMHCKHRIGILGGQPKGLVGENSHDLETVAEWVRGSDVAFLIGNLLTAEGELEALSAKVKRLKKALAQAMLD